MTSFGYIIPCPFTLLHLLPTKPVYCVVPDIIGFSLVFCGKSVLRLALVHSKYIQQRKLAETRTQRKVKFF